MIRLVIVNPCAGSGKKGHRYVKRVEKIFNNLKKELDYNMLNSDKIYIEQTMYIGHAVSIVKEYIESHKDEIMVYVLGGDGTLSEVAEAIRNKENVSMVVVPCGTGNDFSKAVTGFKSMRKIIKESLIKEPEYIDSIELSNCKVAVNVVNAGFDAEVADNVRYFKKIPLITGEIKYNLAIFLTLLFGKTYRFKIRVDEKVYKGKYTLVAIGNNKYYGGGIKVLPNAEIDDGLLDICIVKNTTIFQKLRFLPKFVHGKHESMKSLVKLETGEKFSIVSNKSFPVSVDGEIYYTRNLKANISKKGIRVVRTRLEE